MAQVEGKKLTRAEKRVLNKAAYRAARSEQIVSVAPHPGKSVIFSADMFDLICDRVAGGLTLRQACREMDICEKTVRIWILDDRGADYEVDPPVLGASTLFARARLLQSEAWADHLIELGEEATEETIQLQRFRSDQFKWLMGKNNPRYNDKLTVSAESTVKHEHTVSMSEDLAEFIGALDAAARAKSFGARGTRLVGQASSSGATDSRG